MTTKTYLDGLNEAQLQGVLHQGSPLFVLAGPGTGKTKLIISRIVHLICDQDIDPSTIVAMTFTNKAANELRQRLAQHIADLGDPSLGAAAADSVHAGTFHSFGLRLLRRFGDIIGLSDNPTIIDSAQRRRLLRELLTTNPVYGRLIGLGREALISEAVQYFQVFAHIASSPHECDEFVKHWASNLQDQLDSAGNPIEDEQALAAQRALHERFASHVKLFGLYKNACTERGWISLDDLITLPSKLLREHQAVRDICHSEFRHFVVDEFQDVNQAQIEFVSLLAPPASNPDLVLVGDDDQAIYAFRGADEYAFARAHQRWENASKLALTENYRSQEPIIAASNAVISRASMRFDPDKTIERARSLADEPLSPGAGVEIIEQPDDRDAGQTIASMITTALADRPGLKLSDIAVIARTHGELDRIADTLAMENIPIEQRHEHTILDDPTVEDFLTWISVLVDPASTSGVNRLLIRSTVPADHEKVSRWLDHYSRACRAAKDQDAPYEDSYIDWLAAHVSQDPAVAHFLSLYRDLHASCTLDGASQTIWNIITTTNLIHADLPPARVRTRRIDNFVRIIKFAQSVQPRLDPPKDLAAFWSYYNDLDPKEQTFNAIAQDALTDEDDAEDVHIDRVQLITAHAAKGLEFDLVFLPRVNPPHGYPMSSGSRNAVELPEGLIDRLNDTRSEKERDQAEERRIFYVACTRAQRRLVLLTKATKSASKSLHFAQELTANNPDLVVVRSMTEVLDQAARIDEMAQLASATINQSNLRIATDCALRQCRSQIAAQLDRLEVQPPVETADDTFEDIKKTIAALTDRHAAIAAIAHTGTIPPWADRCDPVSRAILKRLQAIATNPDELDPSSPFKTLKAPFTLSYSFLNDYKRCPACFYVKRVLGLGDAPSTELSVGSLVHELLEAHAKAWQLAEASGQPLPTLESLLAKGRAQLARLRRSGEISNLVTAEELDAMLANAHEMMHEDNAEILEVEYTITMPYEYGGQVFPLKAKLDRVDRTDAGVRIVDYKTGQASKSKLEPCKTDLQLGIYAMAIEHDMQVEQGCAQYWLVREKKRGTIELSDIKLDRIHKDIDNVISGILAGDYPRKANGCSGLCELIMPCGHSR